MVCRFLAPDKPGRPAEDGNRCTDASSADLVACDQIASGFGLYRAASTQPHSPEVHRARERFGQKPQDLRKPIVVVIVKGPACRSGAPFAHGIQDAA